jgi:hypothetical protein
VAIIPKGVASTTLPWARSVESRLDNLVAAVGRLGGVSGAADKTVYSEFSTGQNIALGTDGRVEPTAPVALRYVTSTGLFEVTVSLAGLVRDGAVLGAGFESADLPYEIYFDIPRFGVVNQAPLGQTTWMPFSASYSTVITSRPGVQDLNLYLYSVCTSGASSAAFVKRARLSVRAV